MTSWSTEEPCPRYVKTAATKAFETEDTILPNGIRVDQLIALPGYIAETYEECSGSVKVSGYYDGGRTYGDPGDCYPPEGDNECGECDSCGADNWSEIEKEKFEEDSRAGSDDGGPDEDDRDD